MVTVNSCNITENAWNALPGSEFTCWCSQIIICYAKDSLNPTVFSSMGRQPKSSSESVRLALKPEWSPFKARSGLNCFKLVTLATSHQVVGQTKMLTTFRSFLRETPSNGKTWIFLKQIISCKSKLREDTAPLQSEWLSWKEDKMCWRECGEKGSHAHCWREWKSVQPHWKTVWEVPQKLKIEISYDPVVPLLGIYRQEMKSVCWRDSCTMFTAASFTIVKIQNQHECLPIEEWLKEMWFTHTTEYYSAIKECPVTCNIDETGSLC